MAGNKSPLPQIIRQLRDVLRATRYTMMADVEPLVEQAFILLGFEDQEAPQTQVRASELAYNIAMMLEHTQDSSIIRLCMGMLMKLGGMGEILTASYLLKGRIPRESLLALLDEFAPQHKLFMANRFFTRPYKGETWFMRWAHEVARSIQGQDPEEALLFLEALPKSRTGLSYPLQRELLRGRFGVWLQRLLHLELNSEQLAFMVTTTQCLGSHFVSLSMAQSLPHAEGEVLAMLLRSMGRNGRKQDPALTARILPLVRHEDDEICLAALEALADLKAEKLPQALALVHTRRSSLQAGLLPLILRLDAVTFRIFMQRLPRPEQLELMPRLVALFATFDPVWLLEALERIATSLEARDGQWRQLKDMARNFILAHQPVTRKPRYSPTPLAGPKQVDTTPRNSEQETAAFALFEKFKRGLGGKDAPQAPVAAQQLGDLLQKGGLLEKIAFEHQDLPSLSWGRARLLRCTLSTSSFSRNLLDGVRFEKCVLRNLDMEGLRLENVVFEDCELTNCRLARSLFSSVQFKDCVVYSGQFADCVFKGLTLENCRLVEADFAGSRFEACALTSSLMHCAHFCHAAFSDTTFAGMEFTDCRFSETCMERCQVRNSVASTSTFTKCGFHGLDTDEPSFLRQERTTSEEGRAALAGRVKPGKTPLQLGSADGLRLLFLLLEQWFFEKDLKEREALFLANNRRRLDWAMCMLPSPADDFLRMLPAILESDGLVKGDVSLAPACAIHNYIPDFGTRRLLEKHGIAPPTAGEDRNRALKIEGVYTIGSTGTIAHARASDIDLWVCYRKEHLTGEQVRALHDKLQRIEAWASASFGVEVHFFFMDVESVRNNEFGYTDKESAGSSQAQLLKEEFYRTGVYLAGKKPVWWYVPPDVDRAGYRRHIKRFHTAVGTLDTNVLDLGHLEEIPKDEFFGASLWQIVKAIKSPFKSALKLALLDKYTHGKTTGVLLCNRIKGNVFLGARDLWDIDPYALMFREIFDYYREIGDREAQDLMRLAFLHKTGLYLAAQSTGRFYEMQDYSFMEYFFPYSEADIASHVEPGRGVPTDEVAVARSYAELVALGQMMVRYMLKTYDTIHKLWGSLDLDMRVTDEDMTKLGRKVFSYLRPKENKIMRVPFMDASKTLFSALEFACQGMAGTPVTWIVSGEAPKRQGRRFDKEEIRRGKQLEPVLAWLVANSVYTPGMSLLGSSLTYPLSLGDLTEALSAIHAAFPVPGTFDTDIEEYLRPEQVLRALCLINFTVPREERRIRRASLLYATNWGELFCLAETRELHLLQQRPHEFLRANTGLELHKELDLHTRTPPKSLCPPVRLW
jgi:adenylate cyclase, class 1